MPNQRGKNTAQTTFTAPKPLIAKAKKKAKAQRRTLSNYVALLLERDLEEDEKVGN